MTVQGRAELTIAPKDPPPQVHNHYSKPPRPEYHPHPKGQPILAQSMYLRQHPPQQKAKNMAPSPPTAPKALQPRGLSPKEVKGSHPSSLTHGMPVYPQPLVSVAVSGGSRFDVLQATQGLEGKGARAQQLYEAVSRRVAVEIIPRTTYAPSPYPAAAAAARAPSPPTSHAPASYYPPHYSCYPDTGRSSQTTSSPAGRRRTQGSRPSRHAPPGTPCPMRTPTSGDLLKDPCPRASWTTGLPWTCTEAWWTRSPWKTWCCTWAAPLATSGWWLAPRRHNAHVGAPPTRTGIPILLQRRAYAVPDPRGRHPRASLLAAV